MDLQENSGKASLMTRLLKRVFRVHECDLYMVVDYSHAKARLICKECGEESIFSVTAFE